MASSSLALVLMHFCRVNLDTPLNFSEPNNRLGCRPQASWVQICACSFPTILLCPAPGSQAKLAAQWYIFHSSQSPKHLETHSEKPTRGGLNVKGISFRTPRATSLPSPLGLRNSHMSPTYSTAPEWSKGAQAHRSLHVKQLQDP